MVERFQKTYKNSKSKNKFTIWHLVIWRVLFTPIFPHLQVRIATNLVHHSTIRLLQVTNISFLCILFVFLSVFIHRVYGKEGWKKFMSKEFSTGITQCTRASHYVLNYAIMLEAWKNWEIVALALRHEHFEKSSKINDCFLNFLP